MLDFPDQDVPAEPFAREILDRLPLAEATLARFEVALFCPVHTERELGENGEALRNGRIRTISPAEVGASPWS
jgi:hypothetical protein